MQLADAPVRFSGNAEAGDKAGEPALLCQGERHSAAEQDDAADERDFADGTATNSQNSGLHERHDIDERGSNGHRCFD